MKTLLFTLFLAVSASAQYAPVGYSHWRDQADTTLNHQRIGGQIGNYPNTDSTWATIENDWITTGDTLHTNRRSVLRTDVNDAGQSTVTLTMGGNTYTVSQRLIKMVWINTQTQNWIDIADVSWNTPTVDSNIIHWQGIIPGVDYRVRKDNGQVEHGVFFKPAFIDSAITLYDQRADSQYIALGNVMAYTLTGVDEADSALRTVNWRKLKDFGRYVYRMGQQSVHYPGSDTMPNINVKQRWIKQGNKLYCVEYVMMHRIKQVHEAYPSATIWHNAQLVIDGTTNVEDTWLYPGQELNFGGDDKIDVYTDRRGLIRVLNLSSLLGAGATISNLACSLYSSNNYTGSFSVYRVFKPWGEGTGDFTNPPDAPVGEGVATWFDWSNDDEEWGVVGCDSANDAGSDNNTDGDDADRKATAEGSFSTTTFGWYTFSVTNALAQDWYDGDANENGVLIARTSGTDESQFNSTEEGGNPLFWCVTYTTSAGGAGWQGQIIPVTIQ